MQERLTRSIVLFGDITTEDTLLWRRFYEYSTGVFCNLNLDVNYLGVTGGPFKSSKILRLKNAKNRLVSAFEQGAEFKSLELYSLPDDYQVAAYDYKVYVSRTIYDDGANILVSVSNDYFDQLDLQQIAIDMKQFIHVECGQIFEMSNIESPQLYAAVAKSGRS